MGNLLAERIKMARNKAGLTQARLAEMLGIAHPTLNKYERGHRVPDASLISRMANLLGCDPGWLVSGGAEERPGQPAPGPLPLNRTPVLSAVPSGFPGRVAEDIAEYISLPDVPEEACALIVNDDSMSPALKDGDYLIFTPDKKIKSGDIVVVNNEWGESMARRYRKKNNRPCLASDNPEYPVIDVEQGYKIMGKVVAVWRKIKI